MEILDETVDDGVIERRFDLKVDTEVVPGIHWLPEYPAAKHPTVLIGHGGTQHKRIANVLGLARKIVRELRYGVVALDAPGHGDRMTDEQREAMAARLRQRREGEQRPPADADRASALTNAAPMAVKEWKTLLDQLQQNEAWADGPFGYWGVSMGCAFGMPLIASEPRISAAVLGLAGARDDRSLETAAKITIPLLFLFQAEDQLMTVESGIKLWQAFGSEEKTLHMNPGPHVGIPKFERAAAVAFFQRHFGTAGGVTP